MANLDEQICSYLDGSMSPAELKLFESALAQDPGLFDMCEQWRRTDEMLRDAYPVMASDINAAMIARLGLETATKSTASPANDNSKQVWSIGLAGGAIAASIAAVLVLISTGSEGLDRNIQFQQAMESAASGQTVAISKFGSKVRPTLTFASADGRFCREFSLNKQHSGIVCRTKGKWIIEAETETPSADTSGGAVRTAAGTDLVGLDSTYQRLGASDPIDIETESYIISSGWKK